MIKRRVYSLKSIKQPILQVRACDDIHHLRSISSPRYMKTYTCTDRSPVDEQSTGPCGWITTYLNNTYLIPHLPQHTYLPSPISIPSPRTPLLTSQQPKRKDIEDRHQYSKKNQQETKQNRTNNNVHPHNHPLAPLLSPTLHQHRTLPGCNPHTLKHDDDHEGGTQVGRGDSARG